jgi:hypothetical protein
MAVARGFRSALNPAIAHYGLAGLEVPGQKLCGAAFRIFRLMRKIAEHQIANRDRPATRRGGKRTIRSVVPT